MSNLQKMIVVVVLAAQVVSSIPLAATAATTNAPSHFIIGVWAQPTKTDQRADNFTYWKNLGVNTLVGYDSGSYKNVSMDTWDAAAKAADLKVIRWASGDVAKDTKYYKEGFLLAWQHYDEPDKLSANLNRWDDYTLNTAILNPAKKFEHMNTTIPVFMNLMGDQVTTKRESWYTKAVTQGADFYSFDFYPFNRNYTINQTLVAKSQSLVAWTGKYPLVYIETSDQKLPGNPVKYPRDAGRRGPTPNEIKAQMATAVALGAPGILFFPQRIGGGFLYDGTTPEGAAVMKDELKKWSGLTANPGTAVAHLPAGLIGRDRTWNGKTMRIIVNTSQTASVSYDGKTYKPLEYTSKVIGGVSRDVPDTTKPNTQPQPNPNPLPNPNPNPQPNPNPVPTTKSAQTLTATNITKNSAVIRGKVNAGDIKGVAWFEYGDNQGDTFGETWPYKAGVRGVTANNPTDFEATIRSLTPGKTYHFRIMVETATGKKYGETLRFTTPQQ